MRNTQAAIVFCLAYVLGLLVTFNPWVRWGLIVVAIPLVWMLPRIWKKSPSWQFLLVAIAIGGCASFYLELRIPRLAANNISDISQYIPATAVHLNLRSSKGLSIVIPTSLAIKIVNFGSMLLS
jgi:competence protein ComEC